MSAPTVEQYFSLFWRLHKTEVVKVVVRYSSRLSVLSAIGLLAGCSTTKQAQTDVGQAAAPMALVAKAPKGNFGLSSELVGGQLGSFSFPCFERARAMNWCWCSCVQSVLCQANIQRTQEQIAAMLDGWPRDRPAYIGEVVALLQVHGLRAWAVGYPASPEQLYSTLDQGYKLIAFVNPHGGMVGHFIVLQGRTPNGMIVVSEPSSGATYAQTPSTLYYAWVWRASIVVGR